MHREMGQPFLVETLRPETGVGEQAGAVRGPFRLVHLLLSVGQEGRSKSWGEYYYSRTTEVSGTGRT